jgi:glyoxylase-like metal-dependent hydrolase (beta-lactamase superfamily II)
MLIEDDLALIASMQFGLGGACDCHVYAIRAPDGVVLIDSGSGMDTGAVLSNLADHFPEVPIAGVLLTHCHMDHAGGLSELRSLTGCAVFTSDLSRRIVEDADEEANGLRFAREVGVYPKDLRMKRCLVDEVFADGVPFSVGGLVVTPIHVPGHSVDAFCLMIDDALFSGDVVFYGGVLGLINAEGSDLGGYRSSFHKLGGLGIDALFPGHGLFTLRDGQKHIDAASEQLRKGVVPRMIGQGDLIF